MLKEFCPRVHGRYASLPVLGVYLGGYIRWALALGFHRDRVRCHLRSLLRFAGKLRSAGVRQLEDLTSERFYGCIPKDSQEDADLAGAARLLGRYLREAEGLLVPPPDGPVAGKVSEYRRHLENARGFAGSTLAHHTATATEFLTRLGCDADPGRLARLTRQDIEDFVRVVGDRIGRASLQHSVAHLRSFLRFLIAFHGMPPGLDQGIDSSRVYRGEQLPRSLPWATVRALLASIDRASPMGSRDHAIFLLIATYGLRACEVVALRLEDIEWRDRRIRVPARKMGVPHWLPLTDDVATVLVDYLRNGRPRSEYREVFLRCRTPEGTLKPTAVTEAFQAMCRRSGMSIPYQGPHCLRHSLAVHLLRQGVGLKTIGDLLGHRSGESTGAYLRLAIEDLREVALSLPCVADTSHADGGQP